MQEQVGIQFLYFELKINVGELQKCAHVCNPNIPEVEAGGSEALDHR